jgi:signal transduction histidine kinase
MPQSGTSEGIAAPVPGINDLRRLVDQVRDAGVDVSLAIEGDVERLPATTGSTVYRIVQEALTNAAKHAPGASVAVSAAVRRTCIEVDVDSAGSPGRGAGMGLVNMRTRAEAVGGTCTAGPGGRGWLVRASLPVAVTQGADLS